MEDCHRPIEFHDPRLTTDEQEAWGIATDLIADLGRADAVAWAEEYMDGLRDAGSDSGIARWSIVTNALSELTGATRH